MNTTAGGGSQYRLHPLLTVAVGGGIFQLMLMSYRIRISDLMKDKGLTNGYQLARDADIPETTAYRLIANEGSFRSFDSSMVKKLCAFWGKTPMQLIEWVDEPMPKREKKRKAK